MPLHGATPPVERLLAATAVSTGLEDWSPNAVERAGAAIADTFTIGLAGLVQEQTRQALSSVAPSLAPESVPLWSTTDRYALADAAFVLGTACHALDWDDYMHPMHGHCSSVLLPVAWSIAESRGGSGTDLVEAFLAGYQVNYLAARLFGSAHYERGWHATSTVGTLGAAATAARLLKLDEERTAAALAIAASFASGIRANFGTTAKALHAGAAARHGVQAAQLARAGATGSERWLLGPHGMLATLGGELGTEAAESVLREKQGSRHGIESSWGQVQKPHSCCGSCHAAIDGLIDLSEQLRMDGQDAAGVERIEIHVDPLVPNIMSSPAVSPFAARYCLPWAGAVAVADRAAGPAQFSWEALARVDLHRLSERVQVVPDLVTTADDRFAAHVVLYGRGTRLEKTVRHAVGHPENPMSSGQREAKQRAALRPLTDDVTADELIAGLAGIHSLPRLSDLSDRARRALRSDRLSTRPPGLP